MKHPSPTHRTLKKLLTDGWLADVVERRIHSFVTKDLFGFADVLAMREGAPCLLVQATSKPNMAARVTKIMREPNAGRVLRSGHLIQVWGWDSKKDDPPRVVEITAEEWDAMQDAVASDTASGSIPAP